MSYKYNNSFKKRKTEVEQILLKYPERIPIICQKNHLSNNVPDIDKHKYLVNSDLTIGQFMYVIRKRIKLLPEIGLYFFIGGTIPSNSNLLSNLYSEFKDPDGFLYITYDIENTFGSLKLY